MLPCLEGSACNVKALEGLVFVGNITHGCCLLLLLLYRCWVLLIRAAGGRRGGLRSGSRQFVAAAVGGLGWCECAAGQSCCTPKQLLVVVKMMLPRCLEAAGELLCMQ
jgi:hypothetical protein